MSKTITNKTAFIFGPSTQFYYQIYYYIKGHAIESEGMHEIDILHVFFPHQKIILSNKFFMFALLAAATIIVAVLLSAFMLPFLSFFTALVLTIILGAATVFFGKSLQNNNNMLKIVTGVIIAPQLLIAGALSILFNGMVIGARALYVLGSEIFDKFKRSSYQEPDMELTPKMVPSEEAEQTNPRQSLQRSPTTSSGFTNMDTYKDNPYRFHTKSSDDSDIKQPQRASPITPSAVSI